MLVLRVGLLCDAMARVLALSPPLNAQASIQTTDALDVAHWARVAPRVYMVGLQKSGTTSIAAAFAAGLGVKPSLEAANSCCCQGHSCGDQQIAACVNENHLTAPLFNGSAAQYYEWCATALEAGVAKSDDMLWQVGSLMHYTNNVPAGAPGYRTQFVFLVRHPLFTIASLLAWCDERRADHHSCEEHIRSQRHSSGTNLLYYRIFALPKSGVIAASPVSLAHVWKAAARLYLDDAAHFSARMRYEDFIARPVAELERLRDDLERDRSVRWGLNPTARLLGPLDHERITKRMDGYMTYMSDYNHFAGNGDKLFDEDTTSAIVETCSEEMTALGYTSEMGVPMFDDAYRGLFGTLSRNMSFNDRRRLRRLRRLGLETLSDS